MSLDILRWTRASTATSTLEEAQAPPATSRRARCCGGALESELRGGGAQRGAELPQPPSRLPHLRPGRRVPPAGLLAGARPQAEAHARGAGAQAQGRRLRAHHRLRRRERCIVCTRCIRTSRPRSPRIRYRPPLRERGNLGEITVSPGRQLDHDYTLMTECVCPVSALHLQRLPLQGARLVPTQRHRLPGLRHRNSTPSSTTIRATTRPTVTALATTWRSTSTGCATRAAAFSYKRAMEDRLLAALVGGDDATVDDALSAAKDQLKGHKNGHPSVAVILGACSRQRGQPSPWSPWPIDLPRRGRLPVSGPPARPRRRHPRRARTRTPQHPRRNADGLHHAAAPHLAELLAAIDAGHLPVRHRPGLRGSRSTPPTRATPSPSSRAW